MVENAVFGLTILTLGWIIQLIYSWNGKNEIKKRFLILYGLGTALLVIDAYSTQLMYTMTINFISLVVVMLILIKIGSTRESTSKKVVASKSVKTIKKKRR